MRKNMKGFTLIELLAVIVILAVIALIATPIIMNVINDAKKGADRDSAYSVVKAVETSVAQKMVTDTTFKAADCTFTISGSTVTCGSLPVDIKGTKPTAAEIKFDAKGAVGDGTLVQMGTGWFKLTNGKFGEPTSAKPTA